jgi:hypothetical protein
VSERWQNNGSFGFLRIGPDSNRDVGKTKCAILRVGFFVVYLFVNFCTVVCSLGLQLTVCGFAFVRDFGAQTVSPAQKPNWKTELECKHVPPHDAKRVLAAGILKM